MEVTNTDSIRKAVEEIKLATGGKLDFLVISADCGKHAWPCTIDRSYLLYLRLHYALSRYGCLQCKENV
jgi:hypothetical protein